MLDSSVPYILKYIGTAEMAPKFKYKFKLGIRSDKISICNIVSSYTVDVQEGYKTGKRVKLYCGTFERYLDGKDDLKFSFESSNI